MKRALLFALYTICAVLSWAQGRNYNVIMGDMNWLNFFNEQASILASTFDVTIRSASISEPDGALSLVVDETGIHNANFDLVQGGSSQDLGWPMRLAGFLILPKPNAPQRYMVFVNTPENDTRAGFVEVDMSLNSGAGGVVGSATTWYMTEATAKLAATTHANGTDYWVVQHKNGSDEFHAFRLHSAGFDTQPVISASGPDLAPAAGNSNYSSDYWSGMTFSLSGDKLAMGYNITPDSSGAAIFGFDDNSGQLQVRSADLRSTLHTIDDLTGDTIVSAFRSCFTSGVEFISSDDFLYVAYLDTTHGDGGSEVIQYDLSWPDPELASSSTSSMGFSISMSDPIGTDTLGPSLLAAPDGRMYLRSPHGYNNGVFRILTNAPHSFGETPATTFTSFFSPALHDTWGLPLFCKRYHDSEPAWLGVPERQAAASFRAVPNPISERGALVWGDSPPPDHLVWRDGMGRMVRSEPALNNGPTTVLLRQGLAAGPYLIEVGRQGRILGTAKVLLE